jgi:hypothetical protein
MEFRPRRWRYHLIQFTATVWQILSLKLRSRYTIGTRSAACCNAAVPAYLLCTEFSSSKPRLLALLAADLALMSRIASNLMPWTTPEFIEWPRNKVGERNRRQDHRARLFDS